MCLKLSPVIEFGRGFLRAKRGLRDLALFESSKLRVKEVSMRWKRLDLDLRRVALL
jgi:hypothetical protein